MSISRLQLFFSLVAYILSLNALSFDFDLGLQLLLHLLFRYNDFFSELMQQLVLKLPRTHFQFLLQILNLLFQIGYSLLFSWTTCWVSLAGRLLRWVTFILLLNILFLLLILILLLHVVSILVIHDFVLFVFLLGLIWRSATSFLYTQHVLNLVHNLIILLLV